MKTRAIVQINPVTGQKNVTFSSDPLTPLEDFLAPWPNSEVHVGEVLILSADGSNIVDYILDTELRSVDNDMLTPEEINASILADMLRPVVSPRSGGLSSVEWDQVVCAYVNTLTSAPLTGWERTAKGLIDSLDDRNQE